MNIFSKLLFALSLLVASLHASSLNNLIEKALKSHPSLLIIKERISFAENNILLSRKFSNPKLILGINDIQTDDITNRSIERMQTSSVSIEQQLPYFGKRDAKELSANALKEIQMLTLEDSKTELISKIKQSAYKTWELKTLYEIICKFESLTEQSIDLSSAYSATSPNQHMGIMSATMSLSDLRIKKNILLQNLESEFATLSFLTASDISDLTMELNINKLPNIIELANLTKNNFKIKIKKTFIEEAKATLRLKDLNHYSDPTIKAGYYYRENFEDYLSISLGVPLPIYGSENLKSEMQRKKILEQKSALQNSELKIKSKLKDYYSQMRQAYITHTIITKESMPQIKHMYELSSSNIATGADLFKYIDLIKQELKLENQRISSIAEYHKYRAKIDALLGIQK